MCIGSRTGTPSPRLDAEEIVEEHGDEVMMEKLARLWMANQKGEDGQARHLPAAKDDQILIVLPSCKGPSVMINQSRGSSMCVRW